MRILAILMIWQGVVLANTIKDDPNEWEIPFSLIGKEKISRQIPPDIPLIGGMGKRGYLFDGKIQFNTIITPFKSEWYEPKFMINTGGNFFLLCWDYLYHDKYIAYQYQQEQNRFLKVDIDSLYTEWYKVECKNRAITRTFRLWCLMKMLDANMLEKATDLFEYYTNTDPNCLLTLVSPEYINLTSSLDVDEVVLRMLTMANCSGKTVNEVIQSRLYPLVEIMIASSLPDNNYTEIFRLLRMLYIMDNIKAQPFIVDLFKRRNEDKRYYNPKNEYTSGLYDDPEFIFDEGETNWYLHECRKRINDCDEKWEW